jgi:hypothetical protein
MNWEKAAHIKNGDRKYVWFSCIKILKSGSRFIDKYSSAHAIWMFE